MIFLLKPPSTGDFPLPCLVIRRYKWWEYASLPRGWRIFWITPRVELGPWMVFVDMLKLLKVTLRYSRAILGEVLESPVFNAMEVGHNPI